MNKTLTRFLSKIPKSDVDHCWLWQGRLNTGGYGVLDLSRPVGRKYVLASRFAYEHWSRKIPDNTDVRQVCGNRSCVNPKHLELRRHGGKIPNPAINRFWKYVQKGNQSDCWIWKGYIHPTGYGYFSFNQRGKPNFAPAYRFAYQHYRGLIPEHLELDHLCRNRLCVNPDHLEAVTPRENNLRGNSFAGRNARKTHCAKGHPLTQDNLKKARSKTGRGQCRICANNARMECYYRKKQKLIKEAGQESEE